MTQNKYLFLLLLFLLNITFGFAQLETQIIKPSESWDEDHFMFFTNRTLINNENGSISFKKNTTKQTNTLYFCRYDFANDSIEVQYKTVNLNPNKYVTDSIKYNPFYSFYEHQRIDRGIKNFYFIVGGYGKNFDKQVHSYMQRIKSNYADSLFKKVAIIVFAWGDEGHAWRYYNGVRAARRGSADFAIFQSMLDDFMSDTTYFKTHPKDITVDIAFSSMGNYLFKDYLEERKRQNIPLKKVYNKVILLGSVTSRHSLEEGHEFYGLDQMTDSLDVYVNRKDALLWTSGLMHFSPRLGRRGPKHEDELEGYINVIQMGERITMDDLPGLGHDYFLTNESLKKEILKDINENVESKESNKIKN